MHLTPATNREAHQLLRRFVEQHPLYTPLRLTLPPTKSGAYEHVEFPGSISVPCETCEQTTTWIREAGRTFAQNAVEGGGTLYRFLCLLCKRGELRLWVTEEHERTGERTVTWRKVGQDPPWDASLPPEARRLSPEDQQLYRRGVVSLGHGFGLGAVAYFRRVVENNVHAFCRLVAEAARAEGDEARASEVEAISAGRVAEDKLRAIAELLPGVLRVGGRNPLKEIYDGYSVALHGMSDEQCATEALRLKALFDFAFGMLHDVLDRVRAFQRTAPPL